MLIDCEYEDLISQYPEEDRSESSVVFDLRRTRNLVIYPLWGAYDRCLCKQYPAKIINHCPNCGATDINLKSGVPSYDLYSTIYKVMDILSKRYETISFISKSFIPTDFVGGLNRNSYTYLRELPFRRNIMHITNDIVHNECLFVSEGIIEPKKDTLTHITIFSSKEEINQHHLKKIIHASALEPSEYLNIILSTSGITNNYYVS